MSHHVAASADARPQVILHTALAGGRQICERPGGGAPPPAEPVGPAATGSGELL